MYCDGTLATIPVGNVYFCVGNDIDLDILNKSVMNWKSAYLWAGISAGILLYLFLLVISIFYIPLSLFLRMLPPIVVVGILLRKTPGWVKCVVAVWLIIAGVYVLFYNDIIGPMTFTIRDRPFDMPGQFNHSWRYFWVMAYFLELSWTWGVPSVLFLLCYKAWHYIRS